MGGASGFLFLGLLVFGLLMNVNDFFGYNRFITILGCLKGKITKNENGQDQRDNEIFRKKCHKGNLRNFLFSCQEILNLRSLTY